MKLFIGISLSLFALACAPGGSAIEEVSAVDPPDADLRSSGAPASNSAPTTGDEAPETEAAFATGQALYVPVYSHVYYGPGKRHFNLACTLSVRNIDTRSPITLTAVDYYNTTGELVRPFVDGPRTLAPLETVDFYIQERDISGGSGANFIVRWGSPTEVNAPIVEAVMIGVAEGQGISFVSPAREIVD